MSGRGYTKYDSTSCRDWKQVILFSEHAVCMYCVLTKENVLVNGTWFGAPSYDIVSSIHKPP
jgi:hypothetical protein